MSDRIGAQQIMGHRRHCQTFPAPPDATCRAMTRVIQEQSLSVSRRWAARQLRRLTGRAA